MVAIDKTDLIRPVIRNIHVLACMWGEGLNA